jgi:hypothetical protein
MVNSEAVGLVPDLEMLISKSWSDGMVIILISRREIVAWIPGFQFIKQINEGSDDEAVVFVESVRSSFLKLSEKRFRNLRKRILYVRNFCASRLICRRYR